MSKDWQQDVRDFQVHVAKRKLPCRPQQPSFRDVSLRYKLIKEEMEEVLSAVDASDMVGLADGICDAIVVLLGTANIYGITVQPIWDEVHRTNMLKKGGICRADGKLLKPEGWQPPEVERLLLAQRMESC